MNLNISKITDQGVKVNQVLNKNLVSKITAYPLVPWLKFSNFLTAGILWTIQMVDKYLC